VLGVSGPSLAGTLDVFYRPAPTRIAMADAIRAVEPASFARQRALVIGGSRGLGEAISKVIAAGAGEVCLTYHRGAADAEQIVGEIRDAGQRAVAIALDVFDPAPLRDRWPFSAPPTHLYYLATPTLFSIRKGSAFAVDELELMIKYYVSGLHATTAAAVALGAERLVVWTPSTSMLDAPSGGVAYCAAKAAMEELCKHLPALLPVTVHAPRLGRVDTDQTASLIAQPPVSAIEIALEQVRRVAR
jgi:NAD(P)-dependent dehydrogenase (short-subunit alcohol dehydrogenase family)